MVDIFNWVKLKSEINIVNCHISNISNIAQIGEINKIVATSGLVCYDSVYLLNMSWKY